MRRLADPWLLLVRMAALALAACALAGPVLLAPARLAAWNAGVVRAVVLDTSHSMRLHGAEAAAREAAEAETRGVVAYRRIETSDLGDGMRQAAEWLATAPPAKREIVVVSDFQSGAMTREHLELVPAHIGVRMVQTGAPPPSHQFTGMALLRPSGTGLDRVSRYEVRLDPETTSATTAPASAVPEGLRLVMSGSEHASALMRVVAAAGTPAPAAAQPIAIVFRGARAPSNLSGVAPGWMLSTAVRLMDDPDVQAGASQVAGSFDPGAEPWIDIAAGTNGKTLVRAAAYGSELAIEVADSPESFLAAAVVRGALVAREPALSFTEQEIVRTPAEALAAFTRAPAPVGREVAVHVERSDARWFWAFVLVLLAVESVLRKARPAAANEVRANAA
jgi:hypothetical protein